MERLKKTGLSLLELLLALVLLTTVLLTASTLLISFKKFYFDFLERQSNVAEISLAALNEIENRITVANGIVITGGSRIDIRVDEHQTPSNFSDDTTYSYWKDGGALKYKYKINGNPASAEKTIAKNIAVLNFELQPVGTPAHNQVKIIVGAIPPGGAQQNFEVIVVTRSSSA